MKEEQRRLYLHYKELASKDNGIIGRNAEARAAEVLKSYPDFEEKGAKKDGKHS